MMKRFWYLWLLLCFWPLSGQSAWEVEVDPLAYALEGHSLHLARTGKDWRVDVGAFGLKTPKGYFQENWTARMEGAGLKLHRLHGSFFWGFGAGAGSLELERTGSTAAPLRRDFSTYGLEAGWRIGQGRWYLVPWLGINRLQVQGEPITATGETFEPPSTLLFPTLHLGLRF